MMVSGSWRLSVEHCLSNSILRPSAPLGYSIVLMSYIKSVLTSHVALLKTFTLVVPPPLPGIFTVPLVEVSSVYG